MKIYLDIDGVLLTSKNTKAVFNVELFIDFLVNSFDCFWLTTHCKGDLKPTIKYLEHFFDHTTIELLKQVKATNWNTLKTEAIDFNSDFYWLDDNPFQSEIKILEEFGLKNKLLIVDLNRNNEYNNLMSFLKSKNTACNK
jgi:hypothetical protein